MNKVWEDHANFLGEMAENVAALLLADDKTEAVACYTQWLSEKCFLHAEKHCRENYVYLSGDGDRVKSDDDGWKAALKDHYGAARPTTIDENEKKDPHYASDDETPTQADIGRMWQKNEHEFERVGI